MRKRSDGSVALARSSGEVATRGRGPRWPWLILVIPFAALKVEAYASLAHHRGALIAALAIGLALAMLRSKLVAIAAFSAGILGFALALHPVLAGAGLGFGAFAVLLVLFFTISTVLHARQRHTEHGVSRRASP